MSLRIANWLIYSFLPCVAVLVIVHLIFVNQLLKGVPSEIEKLSGSRWSADELRKTYEELNKHPIDYTNKLPPRLNRRYVVVGGNGETYTTTSLCQ